MKRKQDQDADDCREMQYHSDRPRNEHPRAGTVPLHSAGRTRDLPSSPTDQKYRQERVADVKDGQKKFKIGHAVDQFFDPLAVDLFCESDRHLDQQRKQRTQEQHGKAGCDRLHLVQFRIKRQFMLILQQIKMPVPGIMAIHKNVLFWEWVN